jgi:uncharacterized protein
VKRVLAFPLVRLALIVLLFAAAAVPIAVAFHPPLPIARSIAANWMLAAFIVVASIVVERVAAEKAPAAIGFDPRHAARDFVFGIVLGAALFSLVVAELAVFGFYHVIAIHASAGIAIAALLLLAGAVLEETLFRGVIFRLIEEWAGTWVALAASAAFFGIAHAGNPGATWFSSVAIALEAGVLLGAAFVVTRNLWFPIGLHFAWNFFEGPVFGSEVSGHAFLTTLIAPRVTGPAMYTGGAFGPEAGLFAVVTCLCAAILLIRYAMRRGRIVARTSMTLVTR